MLLTYFDIQDLLTEGVVENADPAAINGASLDVTLGDRLYLEDPLTAPCTTIDLANKERFLPLEQALSQDEYGPYWLLPPGAFAIAATRERFNLPNNVAIEFKPSLARCGLGHLLAGWRDPGWNNSVLTLEIVNHLRHQGTRGCLSRPDRHAIEPDRSRCPQWRHWQRQRPAVAPA